MAEKFCCFLTKKYLFMKVINHISKISLLGIVVLIFIIGSCDKTRPYDLITPPSLPHFVGNKNQTYSVIVNPAPVYNVVIGTTDVSSADRVFAYNVSSPTGATAGTHYTIGTPGTVTIPAGKSIANIDVHAIYSAYNAGRKDTLVFSLQEASVANLDTVKLFLRGPCFDGDIIFSQLLGNYTKTFENGSYGPYTTTIAGLSPVSATSAKANITNIYDSGITGLATFNWSTVGNFTVIVDPQQVGMLSGSPLFLRTTAPGKFTYCVNAFTIPLELYTASGPYDAWIMTMAR
jgi:hypothetical protein